MTCKVTLQQFGWPPGIVDQDAGSRMPLRRLPRLAPPPVHRWLDALDPAASATRKSTTAAQARAKRGRVRAGLPDHGRASARDRRLLARLHDDDERRVRRARGGRLRDDCRRRQVADRHRRSTTTSPRCSVGRVSPRATCPTTRTPTATHRTVAEPGVLVLRDAARSAGPCGPVDAAGRLPGPAPRAAVHRDRDARRTTSTSSRRSASSSTASTIGFPSTITIVRESTFAITDIDLSPTP